MSVDHYTYRVTWSAEDGEHVGLCAEFPSLSWLSNTPEAALKGIRRVVAEAVADMQAASETIPVPFAEKHYSGEFRVRIPPEVHRALATQAAECVFHRTWTVIPRTLGQLFHVHLDTIGAQRRGVDIVSDPF